MVHADCQAARRRARPQPGKVAASSVLTARVVADLRQGRSPKAIAGRLAAEAADPSLPVACGAPSAHGERVSHEAVYAYVYALPKGELARHGIMLESKRTRRKRPGPCPSPGSATDAEHDHRHTGDSAGHSVNSAAVADASDAPGPPRPAQRPR